MSKSPLIDYVSYTPNKNVPRRCKISKITVHHMAGVMSVEGFGNLVAKSSREMSANYSIGYDARVGYHCEEENRSWCSSSPENDHCAVTIEVSNSACSSAWPVSDKVWAKLVDLCADICKRNDIPRLTFTGDKNGTLTFHSFFTQTLCPGPYIKSRAQLLCDQVNAKLYNGDAPDVNPIDPKTDPTVKVDVKVGDIVSIKEDAVYWSNTPIPTWVKNLKWEISSIKNNRAVLGKSVDGKYNIQSPIDVKYLDKEVKETKENQTTTTEPGVTECNERVPLPAGTPIYYSNCIARSYTVKLTGVYTIVKKKIVNGESFGLLKSGMGWVSIEPKTFKKGDLVSIASDAVYYNGTQIPSWVKNDKWYIDGINKDRIILGKNASGKNNIQSPINVIYLYK